MNSARGALRKSCVSVILQRRNVTIGQPIRTALITVAKNARSWVLKRHLMVIAKLWSSDVDVKLGSKGPKAI